MKYSVGQKVYYNLCRAVDSLLDREPPPAPSDAAFVKACRDELAKRKPEPAAETVGGLAKAVKAARGGDAPPAPMRRFA